MGNTRRRIKRRDLRFSHRSCSIDPPGSKDVDDVLSIYELPDNFLEVGVRIVDVSYFVNKDSLPDIEARSRRTTVYMVGSTYHMLPPILSENLCSLCEGKDRLAVSIIWTVDLDNDFEVLDVWSGKTIIRSRHQLSYAQAQAILDGQPLCEGWEIGGGPKNFAQLQYDLHNLANVVQLYTAIRGRGSFLNASPINSSSQSEMIKALLATEVGTKRDKLTVDVVADRINGLLFKVRSLRMTGSCALNLCGVANGRLDLFYELGYGGPWDVAAGVLIVQEAGGCVFDPSGNEFNITSQRVAVSNAHLKEALVDALRGSV